MDTKLESARDHKTALEFAERESISNGKDPG
jgi:hypothetical protein